MAPLSTMTEVRVDKYSGVLFMCSKSEANDA